jgi:pyridoxine 4-dehydrogenase
MNDIEPIQRALQTIARARNKSMAAVAINYNILKGAVPTVGMRSPEQALANMEPLGWRLTEEEMMTLHHVGIEGKAKLMWQQG